MFLITTRNFPPELGGMQILMGGLSKSLQNYGPVKIFAEEHRNSALYDEKFKNNITRVSGFKFLRKYRKANLVNKYLKENRKIKVLIADHWKSLEHINQEYLSGKKILCLIHSKEINHPINSILNKRVVKSLSKTNFIISNSNFTKKLAINLGLDEKKIKVINPGIDTYDEPDEENIKKADELLKDSFPNLITISRFDKRKGHDKVIMVIKNLKKKLPKIKYICVGYGDQEKNLKRLVQQLDLKNDVIFLDNISQQYKSSLLKKSHLFIMPSIFYKKSVEGFGISFIEAAQHGVPSIGGKDGGASDAIKHKETGLICDGNDLNAIYQSIEYMFQENRYLEFGKKAKDFSKKFDWSLTVKKYIDLLN